MTDARVFEGAGVQVAPPELAVPVEDPELEDPEEPNSGLTSLPPFASAKSQSKEP